VTLAKGFPRRTLRANQAIHRIHRAGKDPWWFSSDGDGRFDPIGTGLGACYLAERPLGAWVEVFRKRMLIAEPEVRARNLFSVELGRDLKLADLTSRRALQFGVTASLGANEDYSASQALAVEAVESGFAGVRYLVRHDPAQKLYGIALFGKAGARATADWASGADDPIAQELADDALLAFGHRTYAVP
jgi:hypothetical protein